MFSPKYRIIEHDEINRRQNVKKARILDEIMKSDMTKIEETLKSIDRDAFNNAVETILKAKKI